MQFHSQNRRAIAEYRLGPQTVAIARARYRVQREAG